MSLTEQQIAALLAEAAGGSVASMFPTVDPSTGRLWYPAGRTPASAQRRKRKASRKRAQASRKISRPRKRARRKRR